MWRAIIIDPLLSRPNSCAYDVTETRERYRRCRFIFSWSEREERPAPGHPSCVACPTRQVRCLAQPSRVPSPPTHAHTHYRPGIRTLIDQAGLSRIQAEHPLLWTEEQQAWLQGSPMAATLAERLQQVIGVCRLPFPHRPQQAMLSRCLARSDM